MTRFKLRDDLTGVTQDVGPDELSEISDVEDSLETLNSRRKQSIQQWKRSTCRDIPVMESCKTRTVIDPDKDTLCLSRDIKSNVSNSSNYKSELLTMWITFGIETVWRSLRHHHHHHLHNNYNHRVNSNCLRTFIISVIILLVSCSFTIPIHGQPPPLPPAGFLDFDNLPVTRFSCEGKVIGGYYADVETGCQMFHVCTLGQKDEIQDIKFLCLNGTVFDQETRVCERVDEVDCSKAEQYFDLNLDLYVPHATTPKPEEPDLEEEDDFIRPVQTSANSKKTPVTTTRATTTTTTPTPSPRTRPPTSSLRSTSPPVISSSSSQQSSSQQDDDEDEEDSRNGNNAYTSFNYYLKTPHSHVASGYNSQSRQSYLINQPTSNTGRGPTGPSGSGSSNNPVAATTSTGRKVPSGPGPKTIIYSSTSTSSSSTQRPKTVVVVKATLPPSKSILKPKTLATPRTTTTTAAPSKYDLDDQYDEYYDDEDYQVEQPQQQQPQPKQTSSFQQTYPIKPSPLQSSSRGSYDFRDGRSTKGVANAGQTIINHSTTGRSPVYSDRGKVSISVSNSGAKVTGKPVLITPANIKVISSEFVGNNSTEDPYYYEDDYPDDATLQQQQQQVQHSAGYSSTSPSRSKLSLSGPSTSRGNTGVISSPKSMTAINQPTKSKGVIKPKEISADTSDYYDDDNENVNAHDHHFTHVDVPRIPYAKPNVPRVLVTNGKPFLPRLRRQSHFMNYYAPAFAPQSRPTNFMNDLLLPAQPSRPLQRSTALQNNYHAISHAQQHQNQMSRLSIGPPTNPIDLRDEARMKAIQWGRDPRPFR